MAENSKSTTSTSSGEMARSHVTHMMPARRVLGDVSPNLRSVAPPAAVLGNSSSSKPLTGSPLKRSFTAALENGNGFRYLKKRRLPPAEVPTRMMSRVEYSPPQTNDESAIELHDSALHISSLPASSSAAASIATKLEQQQHPGTTTTTTEEELQTPTGSPNDDGALNSSADRQSFSSLINYDPSSQPALGTLQQLQPQLQPQPRPSLIVHVPSYAELLRLRLRVALFKVQTNQVHVPFSELLEEAGEEEEEEGGSLPVDAATSVEETIGTLRRAAQKKTAAAATGLPPLPPLLPAPILRPTPYSSRMIYDPHPPSLSSSSPPPPPPTAAAAISDGEKELTSSLVKGRFAEGLLGLKNAADQ